MPTHETTYIPEGWRETTLGEVAVFCYGTMPNKEKIGSGKYPTFSGYKYQYLYPETNCKKGDLIIVARGVGGTGDVKIVKMDCYLTNLSIKISLNQVQAISLFLYYLYSVRNLRHLDSGSAQSQITITDLYSLPLILPPLPEQRAITDMLSSMDAKIELLREQNETLEKTAQTIFHEWFGRYSVESPEDKVNAEGREDGLGQLPEGWRVGKLGEEFDIVMGQSPNGESYNETGDGAVFFQGRAEFTDRFPTIRLYTTEPKRIAEKFDVLVSVRAPVGDINVASEKCCIGRGLAAVKSKHQSYCLYKIKSLKESFDKFESEGTVFGSINKDAFNNIEVVLPTNNVILQFEELVKPIDEKIFNNYQEIQSLSKTRDTLLPKLMSGEVRMV